MREVRLPGNVIYGDGGYDLSLAKISVGPGWGSLLEEVFEKKEKENVPVTIIQVKEKFAGLRIYADGIGVDENNIISNFQRFLCDIERRSLTICVSCGANGLVRGTRRYYTSCDACARNNDAPHDCQPGDDCDE